MLHRDCLWLLIFFQQEQNFPQGLKLIKKKLGLIIAFLSITLWSININIGIHVNLSDISWFWLLILILGQTFLNTGLFITAHDGMHGLIYSSNPRLNNFIGSIAVKLYGLFCYKKLRERHLLHHRFPNTALDPDYHNGSHSSFFLWYGQFMSKYINWQELSKLSLVVVGIAYFGEISWLNLILCWGLPLIFSSLQLFTFGTFFPHRCLNTKLETTPQIHSLNFSPFWSFITCYNFGYHWEHHQYPHLPWWQLSTKWGKAKGNISASLSNQTRDKSEKN